MLVTRRLRLAGVPVALALTLAACSGGTAPVALPPAESPSPVPTPTATVTSTVPDGGVVDETDLVGLTVTDGVLAKIVLADAAGTVLAHAADVTRWQLPVDLPPAETFTLTATAVDAAGERTTFVREFSTDGPEAELKTDIYPWGDQVVGVAHPIIVRLNHPVPEEARAAVEARLTIDADHALPRGSWAWISETELRYRPVDFWPAYTRITVHSDLARLDVGGGVWGLVDRDVTFRTGRAMVLRVDDRTHQMAVEVDGSVVRTVPISNGKAGFETRSGIKMISEKHEQYRMRSATLGIAEDDPEGYDVTVPYALRITNSGEFVHAAPWNKHLGKENRSHGCTNVGLADGKWLYENTLVGDPVVTTGTRKPMEWWNGLGAEWNLSFDEWRAKSAKA